MFRELTEQPEMVIKATGTGLVLSWGLILAFQVLKTPRDSVLRFWTWVSGCCNAMGFGGQGGGGGEGEGSCCSNHL